MTATPLDTHYRRLLRAYPAGRRRQELLDTLLEAAPPGRRRPTAREAGNLVRCGLRARLGRPGSPAIVVTAVLLAFVTGFGCAAVGSWLGWTLAPDLPSGATLAQLNTTVYPGTTPQAQHYGDGVFYDVMQKSTADLLLTGHDEDFEYSSLMIGPGNLPGDYRTWTDELVRRLTAAGWRVGAVEPRGATIIATGALDQDGTWVSAFRGDLCLEIDTSTAGVDTPAGTFDTTAKITQQAPWPATAFAIGGGLLGALVAWLVTGWVSRRTEAASGRVRSLTRGATVTALALLVPQALLGVVGFVVEAFRLQAPHQTFWGMSVTWCYWPMLFGSALLVLSVVVAAVAGREQPEPALATRTRPPASVN